MFVKSADLIGVCTLKLGSLILVHIHLMDRFSCLHKKLSSIVCIVPITYNNIQQGVQTDTTYNIQQCWELLSTELEQVVHTH